MFARVVPLFLVFGIAGESGANQPPDPKPARGCTPDQLKSITLFECPARTTRIVACPERLTIDMAGGYADFNDGVQQWCAPDGPSRYEVGVSPFEGGPARGPYVAWYANGQKAHEGRFSIRGVFTKWHSNGVRSSIKDYGDGRLRGRT